MIVEPDDHDAPPLGGATYPGVIEHPRRAPARPLGSFEYDFRLPDSRVITFRDHFRGHGFPDGVGDRPSHFNVMEPDGGGGERAVGNVPAHSIYPR